jgi:hypothetical protein
MSTAETNGTSHDIRADQQLFAECVAAGRPIPADVVCRVQQPTEQAIRGGTNAFLGIAPSLGAASDISFNPPQTLEADR